MPKLQLTAEENNRLVEWTRRHKTSRALALRARIVLDCAQGHPNSEVAQKLRVTKQTVGKWRQRFVDRCLDGLLDEPRPGAPRQIGDDVVEAVLAKTLHEKPADATHWSTPSLARTHGVSHSTVGRIWQAFRLQPHRQETFKLSTDPIFVDKVRDIVGLYMEPPVKAVVLCVDEKSQIQALGSRIRAAFGLRAAPRSFYWQPMASSRHARRNPRRYHQCSRPVARRR